MRIATLFSGIGSPEQGAKRVYGDDLKMVFACEFDKYARQSFEANYEIDPQHFHKDVNDLDGTQYKGNIDILIGGSPCQAFSIAGLRNGTGDERGKLIYQYIRVVEECEPEIIVYENVRGMMNIDNGNTIKDFVQALRDIGYFCHYGIVNTKDYGVPQNRERLFLVGFKDSDLYHKFHFEDKKPLVKKLKDVLEDNVDEKYYLSGKMIELFQNHSKKHKEKGVNCFFTPHEEDAEISKCITARYYKAGATDPYIKVKSATKDGYEIASIGDSVNLSVPSSKTRRGRVGKQVAQCLDTACNQAVFIDRIRKLTPRECFRLQDFGDDFKFVVSNSQLYKQAGNSMSVNVLEMIFNQIEKAKRGESIGLF